MSSPAGTTTCHRIRAPRTPAAGERQSNSGGSHRDVGPLQHAPLARDPGGHLEDDVELGDLRTRTSRHATVSRAPRQVSCRTWQNVCVAYTAARPRLVPCGRRRELEHVSVGAGGRVGARAAVVAARAVRPVLVGRRRRVVCVAGDQSVRPPRPRAAARVLALVVAAVAGHAAHPRVVDHLLVLGGRRVDLEHVLVEHILRPAAARLRRDDPRCTAAVGRGAARRAPV